MKHSKLWLALVSAGVTGGAFPVHAAEEALDTMVVSATRSEINLKDSPASISVIDEEELRQKTLFTADEALRNTVGVMVRRTKGFMETTPALTIRGNSQAKDNLVLVDGIPQNDANNGQVNWTMIDTENIERIEVLRGPFSSLYGGNAMGGVVSIFTKMPERTGASLKIGTGGALDSIAPEDFRDLSFRGTIKALDSLALGINYRKRGTAGYPTTHVNVTDAVVGGLPAGTTGAVPYISNTGAATNLVGDTGDNWFKDDTLGFSLRFAPGKDTRLDLSHTRSESEYGYDQPHTLLRASVDNAALGTIDDISTLANVALTSWLNGAVFARGGMADQENTGLTFRTELGKVATKLAVGHVRKQTETYIVGGATPAVSPVTLVGGDGRIAPATDSTRTTADLQFDVPILDSHVLTVGVAGTRGELDNERWNLSDWTNPDSRILKISMVTGKDETNAVYLQDAWFLTDDITAYLGARQDWWKFKGGNARFYDANGLVRTDVYGDSDASALSPKLSLVYRPTQSTTLRTSAGRSFRAPMLFELIQTSGIAGQTYVANPDLDPETLTSWELGIDQSFGDRLNMVATYFQSRAKDLIQSVTVTPAAGGNPAEVMALNVGKAEINGVEFEIGGPIAYGLSWSANYTWTDSEITEDPDPTLVGKQLTHTPENQYNLGLDWRQGKWAVSADHYHQSKRFTNAANTDVNTDVPGSTDAFSLTDVKATYHFSEQHSASLGVNNVFNEEYRQFYLSPGRFWFAELRSEF